MQVECYLKKEVKGAGFMKLKNKFVKSVLLVCLCGAGLPTFAMELNLNSAKGDGSSEFAAFRDRMDKVKHSYEVRAHMCCTDEALDKMNSACVMRFFSDYDSNGKKFFEQKSFENMPEYFKYVFEIKDDDKNGKCVVLKEEVLNYLRGCFRKCCGRSLAVRDGKLEYVKAPKMCLIFNKGLINKGQTIKLLLSPQLFYEKFWSNRQFIETNVLDKFKNLLVEISDENGNIMGIKNGVVLCSDNGLFDDCIKLENLKENKVLCADDSNSLKELVDGKKYLIEVFDGDVKSSKPLFSTEIEARCDESVCCKDYGLSGSEVFAHSEYFYPVFWLFLYIASCKSEEKVNSDIKFNREIREKTLDKIKYYNRTHKGPYNFVFLD